MSHVSKYRSASKRNQICSQQPQTLRVNKYGIVCVPLWNLNLCVSTSLGMSAASGSVFVCRGVWSWMWTCMQGLQKLRGYQIQTWAALLGLTNEELLCLRQRNLQHPPFIYTGGRVCLCVCVLCVCACENGVVFKESVHVCDRGESQHRSRWGPGTSEWGHLCAGDGFNCSPKAHINMLSSYIEQMWQQMEWSDAWLWFWTQLSGSMWKPADVTDIIYEYYFAVFDEPYLS